MGLRVSQEMSDEIQADYERRLSGYAGLIHGNEPPALAAKLAIYSEILQQYERYGDDLWRIDPLVFAFHKSLEVDLHLSIARLLEPPSRSKRSLFKFLDFCQGSRARIQWRDGQITDALLDAQRASLEKCRTVIDNIMGRRDKFFAHLDAPYFADPQKIYSDYPLNEAEVVDLANAMIDIVREHQHGLGDGINFHVSEFYRIAADNMVRNLLAGRKVNFPGQVDHIG